MRAGIPWTLDTGEASPLLRASSDRGDVEATPETKPLEREAVPDSSSTPTALEATLSDRADALPEIGVHGVEADPLDDDDLLASLGFSDRLKSAGAAVPPPRRRRGGRRRAAPRRPRGRAPGE
jgi:hypothetical protein